MPLTTVDQGLLSTNAQYTGFKNRLINGDMQIDQRNNGASVTASSSNNGFNFLDRWRSFISGSGTFSVQRTTDAPSGFTTSMTLTTVNAVTPGASDAYIMIQPIEGFNVADFMFGTASAVTVTVSFWAKASITGTYSFSLGNFNNRIYVANYTINSANTWEYKTITIAGDTTGTWPTDNSAGMSVTFDLGSGSNGNVTPNTWLSSGRTTAGAVRMISTAGATLKITGVQLERGSVATSFDVLPYGTELALCQRYYETGKLNYCVIAVYFSGSAGASPVTFKQTKRAVPTMTVSNRNLSPAGAIGSITGQNAYTSVDSNSWLFGVSSGAQNAVSIVELDYTASAEL
jgi:hypothetical protein